MARSVTARIVTVVPRRYRHTSLVLASRSTVGKGRARNVTRIHGQRPLVTIRTVVASRKVVAVIIRQRRRVSAVTRSRWNRVPVMTIVTI